MTEVPPSQKPLETKVEEKKVEQSQQPLTLGDITGGFAKGLLPLVAGTTGGYWATGGPGGVGCGLLLSSLGMCFMIEEDERTRANEIAHFCYKSGLIVGAVLALGALYACVQRQ